MKVFKKNRTSLLECFLSFIIAGIILFIPAQLFSFLNGQIEGIWQGTLKHSGIELRIVFTIFLSPDKKLTATMDVPEQNATDVPVDSVVFEKGNLRLEIIPTQAVFEGKLTESGTKIEGKWIQSGLTIPLVLERTRTKPVIKRPQEPEEPFPYRSEEVIFQNSKAGITLAGTLTLPPSKGPFPTVLLLSGSGAQDRDETVFGHRPFLVMADYLTRKGIAVLHVDARGVGGSTGNFAEATAADYTADAVAGVAYLKSRKEIDPRSIGLLGHSEGGIIAAMTAARSPDIAFIVLIASPGLAIKEMEYSEQARNLSAQAALQIIADWILEQRK